MNFIIASVAAGKKMSPLKVLFGALLLGSFVVRESSCAAPCSELTSCATCIESALKCTWCSANNFTGTRCLDESQVSRCPSASREDPQGSVTTDRNAALSDTVQVQPQEVTVSLRPGYANSFNVKVRPAGEHPLDVYFLMDFSASMRDDLATVQRIANDISDTIQGITSNYRLGFGSFIDKPTVPFFSFDQLESRTIERKYSFKHIVKLTNDRNAFRSAVLAEVNSGNADYPEGGFDGLLQVIQCKDVIGWRDNARHLLIYITDAGIHHAAHGFIGGAVLPNKGQCQMSGSVIPEYYSLNLAASVDYPSVSQIYSLMVQNDIIPIFSCTNNYLQGYIDLAKEIPGAQAAELTRNSDNLLQIIRDEYSKISQTVELTVDPVPGLKVTFNSVTCNNVDPNNPGICNNVDLNSEVEFRVELTVTEVTESVRNLRSLDVRVVFFGSVTVKVNLAISCNCDQSKSVNATQCSSTGNLACGVCECNNGYTGAMCECAPGNNANQACKNGENGVPCSGNGECVCGQCRCRQLSAEEFYSGEACECSNFNCPIDTSGRRCGGKGRCGCDGKCACIISLISNKPYTGELCDCSPDTFNCETSGGGSQALCSGVGTCECNRCICQTGYSGDNCERCSSVESCSVQNCLTFAESCLNCMLAITDQKVGLSGNNCSSNCPNITFVSTSSNIQGVDTFVCDATDVVGESCTGAVFHVPINNDQRSTVYVVEEPPSCTQSVAAWTVAVPIVIALLILGILAVVIAKIVLMFLDYREYKQFEKLTKDVQFGQGHNPLYEQASNTVDNPMYNLYLNEKGTKL